LSLHLYYSNLDMAASITDDTLDEGLAQIAGQASITFTDMAAARSGKRVASKTKAPPAKRPATRSQSEVSARTHSAAGPAESEPPPDEGQASTDPDTVMSYDVPSHTYVHTTQFDTLSARSTRHSEDIDELRTLLEGVKRSMEDMALSHNTLSSTVASLVSRIKTIEKEDSKRDGGSRRESVKSASEILASIPVASRGSHTVPVPDASTGRHPSGRDGEVVAAGGKPRRPRPT